MKTKIGLLTLLSLLLLFSACGKDDKDKDKKEETHSIVGTWAMVHSEGYEKENGKIIDSWNGGNEDNISNEKYHWVFKADGTFTFWSNDKKYQAQYEHKGEILVVGDPDEGETIDFGVKKLTADALILDLKIVDGTDESYSKNTFKKMK